MNASMKASEVKSSSPSPTGLTGVVTVSPHTTWESAVTLMEEFGIHHLVVMSGPKFVGLLCSRDLPSQLIRNKGIHAMLTLPVSEMMRTDAPTITDTTEIGEAVRLMLKHRVSALPVVHEDRVVAILSESDLLRLVESEWSERPNALEEATQRGEAMAANPMVQKIMKTLSDAGI